MAAVPPQYEVVVVGAGVLGLYTAYTMVRKGLKVLLLDQVIQIYVSFCLALLIMT